MADFQIFRNSVRATPSSGSGGTQSNELEAKIKSVTSSTTIGSTFIYDTRSDSDGGAWRKKCQGLSWYDETLNTATRGGRREFPSVALIVADNVTNGHSVTIYDLDDPSAPMWMVVNASQQASPYHDFWRESRPVSSIAALNGRLYFGTNGASSQRGVKVVDFVDDTLSNYNSAASYEWNGYFNENVAGRNSNTKTFLGNTFNPIVNAVVNDVAATIVEGSELGALGLPIPTVAVATAGGISVILANGTVSNSLSTSARYQVAFDENNRLWAANANNGSLTHIQFTDLGEWFTGSWGATLFAEKDHSSASSYSPNYLGSDATVAIGSGREVFAGTDEGLSVFQFNRGNPSESAVAYVTSVYNTGYMLGDIRLSTNPPTVSTWTNYSDGDAVQDRSVKANHLSSTGTVDIGAVATNAELFAFSGFSATEYLSRAYDSDFDFGTGDFSVMFWVKYSSASGGEYLFARDTTSASSNRIALYVGGSNFTVYAGTETDTSALDVDDGQWHQIGLVRTNGKLYTLENGKYGASGVSSTSSVSNGSAILRIGQYTTGNAPATNASISLFRISATAPTPQQVKEIYEAEAPLFRSGAKCLLKESSGETHGSPSAINDLSYDDSTGLLWTTQNSNLTSNSVHAFRGLERVDTFDLSAIGLAGNTQHVSAQSGIVAPVREASSGGAGVSIPAIDVRGDINTADTKLPDDGKIHFSAAISDSNPTTPTVIGVLPIAEGETYYITARVFCKQYVDNTSAVRASYVIEQKFRRPIGGNATASTPMSVLRDEGTASMDAVLSADTGSQQIRLTVTGVANTRSIWSAELDVERISERSYER